VWALDPGEGFSVKSTYALLSAVDDSPTLNSNELKIFSSIWESPTPSKIVAFSWQLLYDRLPTKENLHRRGVLDQDVDVNCVWCGLAPESTKHLFLHCNTAHWVWYEIFKWLGVLIVMPSNAIWLFLIVLVNR
jgi:hypothetical protein